MSRSLGNKLLVLNLRYSREMRQPGWEQRYTDELMKVVLEHHGIKYDKHGLHPTFITWAPHLFTDDIA